MPSKWKRIVGAIAPTLATALGGPMAGSAVKAIAGGLLGDENVTEAEVARAVENASPEQLAELRRIDAEFESRMAELGVELEGMRYADTADAREMAKQTGTRSQMIISAMVLSLYGAVLVFVFGFMLDAEIPDSVLAIVSLLLGVLTGEVPRVTGFWLGSSSGSKSKTAIMGQAKPPQS